MLKTEQLIEGVEEKYVPMLKEVNIVEVEKALAIFSNLRLDCLDEKTVINYLHTWAKNKYFLYELFGNKLVYDSKITLVKDNEDIGNEIDEIVKNYPALIHWLREFKHFSKNEFSLDGINYSGREAFRAVCPELAKDRDNKMKMKITHFLSKYLKLPEKDVLEIAKVWENNLKEFNFTISIDPIDYLMASETPYNWSSCYRLNGAEEESSHCDGCVAAMLDSSQAIIYLWTEEGKYNIDCYEFKKIRYKVMRQWVVFEKDFLSMHFCKIYPDERRDTESNYEKCIREMVEKLVADKLGIENLWKQMPTFCTRKTDYGYSEFGYGTSICHKSEESKIAEGKFDKYVYDEPITCLCGCGTILPPSICEDDCDEENNCYYTGNGFVCENFEHLPWCEGGQCYCRYADDMCYENCGSCDCWRDTHSLCPFSGCLCDNPDCICFRNDDFYDDEENEMAESCSPDCFEVKERVKNFLGDEWTEDFLKLDANWTGKQHYEAQQIVDDYDDGNSDIDLLSKQDIARLCMFQKYSNMKQFYTNLFIRLIDIYNRDKGGEC